MKTILIDIDSLRPDHLGCYGYNKATSPEIDSLSEDSILFENAYVSASPSLPSRAAIFSGRFPESNGVLTHGSEGQEMDSPYKWSYEEKKNWQGDLRNWWNLPELLFHNDINCCAISSFGRYPVPWLFRTWNEFIQPSSSIDNGTHATVDGKKVREKALNWLSANKDTDFFLYIQFWDPHVPCMRDEEEVKQMSDELPTYLQDANLEGEGYRSAESMELDDEEDLRRLVQKYDAEIRHVDKQIGKIIDFLRKEGMYDEVNIILTSDHGEELGENGVFREHWSSFEGTQKVPLIMKLANKSSRRIDEIVSSIDIAPTIADIYDLETPSKWDGKSLIDRLEESDWGRAILAMHGLYTVQRAIIGKRYKYIRTLHSGVRPDMSKEMLFDLKEDPYEQEDLSETKKDLKTDFRKIMAECVEERVENKDPVSSLADSGPYGWKWNSN